MAFFGKVGNSTHAKLRLNIWLSALSVSIGFRSACIRAMQRKFGPSCSARCVRFSNTTWSARFERVSHHGGKALNGTFIRRSVAKIFANVKRKEEAFSGFGLLPLAARLSGYNPIRPSIADRQANLSVSQRAETNARSLFASPKFSPRKSMPVRPE